MIRNRDKRIAILLAAAFAWLFIGSLIAFHQEQVFGKHLRMSIQVFISPKYKDKQALALKLQPVKTVFDQSTSALCYSDGAGTIFPVGSAVARFFDVASFTEEHLPVNTGLRAPPVA